MNLTLNLFGICLAQFGWLQHEVQVDALSRLDSHDASLSLHPAPVTNRYSVVARWNDDLHVLAGLERGNHPVEHLYTEAVFLWCLVTRIVRRSLCLSVVVRKSQQFRVQESDEVSSTNNQFASSHQTGAWSARVARVVVKSTAVNLFLRFHPRQVTTVVIPLQAEVPRCGKLKN